MGRDVGRDLDRDTGRNSFGQPRRGAALGLVAAFAIGLMATLAAGAAAAAPARIILLRHGEKLNDWQLCPVGVQRSQALKAQHLGKGAADSLFRPGETPKAFFAITLHTLELITPAATSWGEPVITYSVLPEGTVAGFQEQLNAQTRLAAHDWLTDPRWDGATIVVTWEHDHIAKVIPPGKADKKQAPAPVTLYDLLGLAKFPDAPANWPDATYDYFWIIDFDPATKAPSAFKMEKQVFTGAFAGVPQNDWGAPNGLTAASKCQLDKAETKADTKRGGKK